MKIKYIVTILISLIAGIALSLSHYSSSQKYFSGLQISYPYPPSPAPNEMGFAKILTLAQRGSAEHQLYMGHFYINGYSVEKNFTNAVQWYAKAAQQGNARAQFYLGLLYDYGLGVEANQEEAFKYYKLAADQEDPAAHLGISELHFTFMKSVMPENFGDYGVWRLKAFLLLGVTESNPSFEENFWKKYNENQKYYANFKEIAEVIYVQATNNQPMAALQFAILSLHAKGVSRNLKNVDYMVKKAAGMGDRNAQFILGAIANNNEIIHVGTITDKTRINYLKMAALDSRNSFFLTYYHSYILRKHFQEKSFDLNNPQVKESIEALSSLAQDGNVEAQFQLGFYLSQFGDLNWMKEAAKNNHGKACAHLGFNYWFSGPEEFDFEKGKRLLDKSLDLDVVYALDYIISYMRFAKKNKPDELSLLKNYLLQRYKNGEQRISVYIGAILSAENEHRLSYEWLKKGFVKNDAPAALLAKSIAFFNDLDISSDFNEIKRSHQEEFMAIQNGMTSQAFNQNLLMLPAALEGYGPAVLDILNIVHSSRADPETIQIWKNRYLYHKKWYTIQSYPYDTPARTFQSLFWSLHKKEMNFAYDNNDIFELFYHVR